MRLNTSIPDEVPEQRASITSVRTKRSRFSEAADTLLLKSVACAIAHVAPWGRKGTLVEEAYGNFLEAACFCLACEKKTRSQKNIEDRLKMILSRRRVDVKNNQAATGITEVYGKVETLLDDLSLKMDEHGERKRAEKDERLNREEKIVQAKRKVWSIASNGTNRSIEKDASGVSPSLAPKDSKITRRIVYESDDEATNAVLKDLELRSKQEHRRLEVEEERYGLAKERAIEEGKRFLFEQEMKKRRMELEKRKADVKIKEREVALLERSKMLEVISGLANKLK